MTDPIWPPKLVEERLAEAAAVLKRLLEPRRPGYFHTWPDYFVVLRKQRNYSVEVTHLQ